MCVSIHACMHGYSCACITVHAYMHMGVCHMQASRYTYVCVCVHVHVIFLAGFHCIVPYIIEEEVEDESKDKIEEEFGDLDQLLRFERLKEQSRKVESEVDEVLASKCIVFGR